MSPWLYVLAAYALTAAVLLGYHLRVGRRLRAVVPRGEVSGP